jgi:hypothetical protein
VRFLTLAFVSSLILLSGEPLLADPVQVLTVEVLPNAVTISGLTPGGKGVVGSITLDSVHGFLSERRSLQTLVDDDNDGILHITPSAPLPLRSIWYVVDVHTGVFSAGTPQGYDFAVQTLPVTWTTSASNGDVSSGAALALDRARLSVLVVRPDVGAWTTEGRLTEPTTQTTRAISYAGATTVAGTQNLSSTQAGDVIIALDPGRMELFQRVVAGQ